MSAPVLAVLTILALPQAPDLSVLPNAQRQAFERVAKEEFCGCQSALTVAGCLELRPDCHLASYLGQLIVDGLKNGASADDVLSFMSERVMGPFCSREQHIDLKGAPQIGRADAPITLVEFADFRCTHCKHTAPVVRQALSHWRKQVRFVFAPFPLSNHALSVGAAEAALAAFAQGKLEPMAKALFAQETELDEATVYAIAKRVGLDMKRFASAMKSHTYRDTVLALKEAGTHLGVESTPTFFVNGRRFEPDNDVFTFTRRFEMELARNQGSCQ